MCCKKCFLWLIQSLNSWILVSWSYLSPVSACLGPSTLYLLWDNGSLGTTPPWNLQEFNSLLEMRNHFPTGGGQVAQALMYAHANNLIKLTGMGTHSHIHKHTHTHTHTHTHIHICTQTDTHTYRKTMLYKRKKGRKSAGEGNNESYEGQSNKNNLHICVKLSK